MNADNLTFIPKFELVPVCNYVIRSCSVSFEGLSSWPVKMHRVLIKQVTLAPVSTVKLCYEFSLLICLYAVWIGFVLRL